ncbi:MAG: hypothetical protein ACPGQL_02045 [Thermoplasmatota archaeon]
MKRPAPQRRGLPGLLGRLRRDESAVSNAVGAVLFFALIALSLVVIRTTYAPVWEADEESQHASEAQEAFAALVQAPLNQSTQTTVPLRPDDGPRFFTTQVSGGDLTFTPTGTASTWSASEMRIQSRDGTSLAGADEQWQEIEAGSSLEDVQRMLHLRLRLIDPADADDGDSVTLTVTDAEGQAAGSLTAYISDHPSGYSIKVQVQDAQGETVFDQGESLFQQDQPPFYWVDALAASSGFNAILAAAAAPFDLDLEEDGLQAAFAATYQQLGTGVQGGSGPLVDNWSNDQAGGSLRFDLQHQRLPQRSLIYDGTAVIMTQSDGATFAVAPDLTVTRNGDQATLRIASSSLTGAGEGLAGRGHAIVTTSPQDALRLQATAPDLSLNQTTDWPGLYEDFWTTLLDDAGLGGTYTVTTGQGWARLDLDGPAADADEHDLHLSVHLKTAELHMEG